MAIPSTPFSSWKCDVCGEKIEAVDDGYVIWHDTVNDGPHDFHVIHQSRCDDGKHHSSGALRDFLGADGLAKLTSMMSYGPLKGDEPGKLQHLAEFTDIFRRMQLPYYEEARQNFNLDSVRDDFSGATEVRPYMQDCLKDIAERSHES